MPTIAVVGRPNVGKSLLFNKLAGKRLSIVEDTPGVTRDRLYASCHWRGKEITLIDTGGIEPHTGDDMLLFMRQQALIAVDLADVIVLVADIRTGMTATDQDVASMLLRSKKPLVLAVNKIDSVGQAPSELYEFYNLGLGEPFPISALHGHGTGDLLDACLELMPNEPDAEENNEGFIRIAIAGKPNAGKSSLFNKMLGYERTIVSEIAGTTRDSVDSRLFNDHGNFILTDTAGIRRKSRVSESIEKYSVLRAQAAIERSDVCLIILDAEAGVTEQDTKISGIAHEAGKPSILVMNKWDAVEKDGFTMQTATKELRSSLAYMSYAPVLFISAKTGQRVERLFPLMVQIYEQSRKRASTGQLNEVLAQAVSRVQPPSDRGRRLKVFYATQAGIAPPHFVTFCNNIELFHFSYRRYLENQIRQAFGFDQVPIKMTVRERGDRHG
ncbi:MAG: ribosome biogenesis GTPase Der [Oscillospiraceae bacterium]|nr:ribosome biogenesis GTPase Der [Oscillospiraceae bacterium]